jgi:hypothetical protein
MVGGLDDEQGAVADQRYPGPRGVAVMRDLMV